MPLNYCFTDWLVIKLRPMRKHVYLRSNLNSDYITEKKFPVFTDRENFVNLLKFLMYAQNLDFTRDSLGATLYRQVVFRLQDFLKYQNPSVKSTNYYQLKKLIYFFEKLQKNSMVQSFTDSKYRSLVTIPEVQLEKSKQNLWIVKVWIAEELFSYQYPFIFPDFFETKLKKDEFEVRFKLLQVLSSVHVRKEFFIKEFFDSSPVVFSNRQKKIMKESFIHWIETLKKLDFIEENFQIISGDHFYNTQELTPKNISEGFVVYEKIFYE